MDKFFFGEEAQSVQHQSDVLFGEWESLFIFFFGCFCSGNVVGILSITRTTLEN